MSSFLSEARRFLEPRFAGEGFAESTYPFDFSSLTPGRQIVTNAKKYLLLEIFLECDFINKHE